jgi:hypothetical protein
MEVLSNLISAYRTVIYLVKLLLQILNYSGSKETCFAHIQSVEVEHWVEPKSSKDMFLNSTKVLWGFWDKGENCMPGICQLSILSWRAKNPEWNIVIISDQNFKEYVSTTDLPSTYKSLIVQHRSDLIRVAVLKRYGGAYLDIPTVIFKGFDHIWDEIPTGLAFQELMNVNGDIFANNGLILSPSANHPFITEWQHRLIKYCENPCKTPGEMKENKMFLRLSGVLPQFTTALYSSTVLILNDMLIFDESTKRSDIFRLSFRQGWIACLPDPRISLMSWLFSTSCLHCWKTNDRENALSLLKNVTALKYSSKLVVDMHRTVSCLLGADTTGGEFFRISVESVKRSRQATINKSLRFGFRDYAVSDSS